MSESHIGFLVKAASIFAKSEINETHEKLKSYYLMRCKAITRGYGLPKQCFSEKSRCSYCLLEWNNNSQTKMKAIKLSKRQKQRIRSKARNKKHCNKEYILYSKKIERICSFCGRCTTIPVIKSSKSSEQIPKIDNVLKEPLKTKIQKEKPKPTQKHRKNVYCKSSIAFALNKEKNTIPSSVAVKPKIIKNNKKRKDKLAGLCQTAVIAAIKLKQDKEKENKLNLFLRPSS